MAAVRPSEKGRILGNWFLEDPLGEGGFGAVYAAHHLAIPERRAAVKLLHPELARQPELRRRFLNEANAASRADHEHIVQIFDGGETAEGLCFVAMELLRGSSLTRALEPGPMVPKRVVHIGNQVASALAAAHRVGIVHRDLKPDNIFLISRDEQTDFVKVLDFGVAKLIEDERLTKTGHILGTPAYMAPEQWRCVQDLDGRADLYSLGIILFRAVTGRMPFHGRTVFEWMEAHLNSSIPDPSNFVSLPRALSDLIVLLLSKERELRPSSAAEVRERLAHCLETTIKASHSHPALLPPPKLDGLANAVVATGSADPPQNQAGALAFSPSPKGTGTNHDSSAAKHTSHSVLLSLQDISLVSKQIIRKPLFYVSAVALASAVSLGTLLWMAAKYVSKPTPLVLAPLPQSAGAKAPAEPPTLPRETDPIPPELAILGPGSLPALVPETRPGNPNLIKRKSITVGRFAISKYEISMGEFKQYADATNLTGDKPWDGVPDFAEYSMVPANQVSRYEAERYCAWRYRSNNPDKRSGRLPSSSEWEFAARSGRKEHRYPWPGSMEAHRINWHRAENEAHALVDVHSLPAGQSAQGVFHLIGNVAEWTRDGYRDIRTGEDLGLTCGGSALSSKLTELSATCQVYRPAREKHRDVGFRCVVDINQ